MAFLDSNPPHKTHNRTACPISGHQPTFPETLDIVKATLPHIGSQHINPNGRLHYDDIQAFQSWTKRSCQ
jgi:hypothetical protein